MSLFENFITEGNGKADELAKRGSIAGRRRNGAGESQHSPERNGRSSKHQKMPGEEEGPRTVGEEFRPQARNVAQNASGHDVVRKAYPNGEALGMVQEMFASCAVPSCGRS